LAGRPDLRRTSGIPDPVPRSTRRWRWRWSSRWLQRAQRVRRLGPPPDGATPVVTIGLQAPQLAAELRGCHTAARIDDRVDIDNDEQGAVVSVCAAPRRPWSDEWPSLRRLG
jgi:hypothetical protein